MRARFSNICSQALLPLSLKDGIDVWSGDNKGSDRAYELRTLGINGNPLAQSPSMVGWNMRHTGVDASFDIVSPEKFSESRAIIVPPQGIVLARHLTNKGYVQKIQAILEFIAASNSEDGKPACLGALVHEGKMMEVSSHIKKAGYVEIGFQGGCYVFVHSSTKSVEHMLLNSLGIK